MKISFKNIAALGMVGLLLGSCKKNELNLNKNAVETDGAFLKIGWFSPATSTQGVQLKINDTRVSYLLGLGFTSTTQYAMPYPGGGLNTGGNNKSDYLSVAPGTLKVSLSVPKKGTNTDSISVISGDVTVEQGKFYKVI
jgi:hypothetical protein